MPPTDLGSPTRVGGSNEHERVEMAVSKVGGASTGLPPGVFIGPLGTRVVAFLIDRSVPVLISGIASIVSVQAPDSRTIVALIAGVLVLAWGLLVWQMYAVRAAGPGMRLMKLQLVGYTDGRPIGWGRFFLRWLVLSLLAATGVGLVLMIIFLIRQPRKQGWHDLAADSVVIKERVLAPAGRATGTAESIAQPRTAEIAPTPADDADAPRTGGYAGAPLTAPSGSTEPTPLLPPDARSESVAPPVSPVDGEADGGADGEAGGESGEGKPVVGPEQLPNESPAERPVPATAVATAAHDSRPLDQYWQVVLDDGRQLDVAGVVLLGRNPQPQPGEEDAQLIKVADDSRTVSKTHLALGVDSNGMYVMDRNSTNGSTVTGGDGQSHKCPPGDIVPVQPGTVVSFGDHWLEVRRP